MYVPSASRQYLAVPHYYEITRARIYCRWTLRACASQVTHSGSPRARTAMLMVMPCVSCVTAQRSKTGRRSTELRSPSLTAPRPRRIASMSSLSRERRVTREDESLRHGRLTDSVLFGPMDGVGVCSFSAMHLPTTVCQSLCRSPARNRWTWAFAAASAAARPRWPSHHPKPALLVIIVQVCCLCRELLQGFKDRF